MYKYESICQIVRGSFSNVNSKDPNVLSPIVLAYIGDAVYDLFVRSYVVSIKNYTPNILHKASSKIVCAKSQAIAFSYVQNFLSEEELKIYQRGRNGHSTCPKNCNKTDYRTATGFEAFMR